MPRLRQHDILIFSRQTKFTTECCSRFIILPHQLKSMRSRRGKGEGKIVLPIKWRGFPASWGWIPGKPVGRSSGLDSGTIDAKKVENRKTVQTNKEDRSGLPDQMENRGIRPPSGSGGGVGEGSWSEEEKLKRTRRLDVGAEGAGTARVGVLLGQRWIGTGRSWYKTGRIAPIKVSDKCKEFR